MSSKPHEVESDVDDDADQQHQLAEITASIIAMAQLDLSSPPPTRGMVLCMPWPSAYWP